MDGYMLSGTNGEYLLVFRSEDDERLRAVLNKLKTMRDKEIKELVQEIEEDFDERYIRSNRETKSKNKKANN